VLEVVIVIVILGLVGGGSWVFYQRSQAKISDSSSPAATSSAQAVSIETTLSHIREVAQKYDYVGTPDTGRLYTFSTNLPAVGWYVAIKDTQNLQFPASKAVSGHNWINHDGLPAAERATVISQSQQFSDAVAAKLKADGFTTRNSLLKFGYTADANAGLYQSSTGVCQIEHTADIPAVISVQCVSNQDIARLKATAQPFVTAFSKKHPERDVKGAVFGQPVYKTSSTGVQYAQEVVSDPQAIDTHPTDGAHYFQKQGTSWNYLTDTTICGTSSADIPAKLTALGVTDSGAAAIFTGFCENLGP
ncbi:MAG: hypothetical protein JWM37_80, partial [Candidatus Saccharibacteria bacterium]|nr:hypothetical protein [Candidatus Saccharibacteria bacterium]